MDYTSKLGMKLPKDGDLVTPEDFNENFRKLDQYVTSLTQACSAISPAALNLSNQFKTVSFSTLVKTGYAFGLSGGGIRVTEPGFVKAHIHVYANSLPAGDSLEMDVAKNGATFWQYSSIDSDSTYVIADMTSRLIPVAANDIITMKLRNWQYNRGKIVPEATYMTVDLYKDLNF